MLQGDANPDNKPPKLYVCTNRQHTRRALPLGHPRATTSTHLTGPTAPMAGLRLDAHRGHKGLNAGHTKKIPSHLRNILSGVAQGTLGPAPLDATPAANDHHANPRGARCCSPAASLPGTHSCISGRLGRHGPCGVHPRQAMQQAARSHPTPDPARCWQTQTQSMHCCVLPSRTGSCRCSSHRCNSRRCDHTTPMHIHRTAWHDCHLANTARQKWRRGRAPAWMPTCLKPICRA